MVPHVFIDSKIRKFRRENDAQDCSEDWKFCYFLLLFVWGNFRYSTGSSSSYVCISHYKSVSVIYSCMHKKSYKYKYIYLDVLVP